MKTTRTRQRTLTAAAATAAVVLVSGFAPAEPPADTAPGVVVEELEPHIEPSPEPTEAPTPEPEPVEEDDAAEDEQQPQPDPAEDAEQEPADEDDQGTGEGAQDSGSSAENPTDEPEAPVDPDGGKEGPEPGPVVIVLPTVARAGEQSWLVPAVDGITWTINTQPVAELARAGQVAIVTAADGADAYLVDIAALPAGHAVVVATAMDGHLIATSDGQQTTTSQVVLDTRQPVELTEPAPDSGGRFVVPDVPGLVVRDHAGALLVPGEHSAADHGEIAGEQVTVTLTVEAAGGYRLENQGVPVEAQPGAGGVWTTVLTLTVEPPADDEPEPAPSMGAPAPRDREAPDQPAETPAAEDDEPERATFVPPAIAASLDPLTHRPAEPEPEADTGDETGEVVEEAKELSQTGPRRLDIISLLGVSSLLAAWVMVRARRDELM